jgi:hypothetical protein
MAFLQGQPAEVDIFTSIDLAAQTIHFTPQAHGKLKMLTRVVMQHHHIKKAISH